MTGLFAFLCCQTCKTGAFQSHWTPTFLLDSSADGDAVRAAVALDWSNGPVEGQINRLKMIKRQMYGRAGLDLLEHRFLSAA